jgi:hypothetical protein
MIELDPRWEWHEVTLLSEPGPVYIKGRCRHTEVVPVESAGEVVAQLCLTCDTQLPAPQ